MELTKTKLNKILKKYRIELEKLNKDWANICKKAKSNGTYGNFGTPTIYDHEAHNSKGNKLFRDLMKEFDGYDVFPKKCAEPAQTTQK